MRGFRLLALAIAIVLAEAIRPGTWREIGSLVLLIVAILMLMLDTTEMGITTPKKSNEGTDRRSQ